ncbi:hypothetical protein BDY19DRAFT_706149 [Irpex rosettiformis]|uniref:Uncharacterized protein n=1 Tax=Irpex rosettiformis TaxID=378272 RepID=A0ACB8TN09_9APHY|nr:hypothetical protein BDY19DRAFT_706149 [Irpex rosettiformis]
MKAGVHEMTHVNVYIKLLSTVIRLTTGLFTVHPSPSSKYYIDPGVAQGCQNRCLPLHPSSLHGRPRLAAAVHVRRETSGCFNDRAYLRVLASTMPKVNGNIAVFCPDLIRCLIQFLHLQRKDRVRAIGSNIYALPFLALSSTNVNAGLYINKRAHREYRWREYNDL